MEERNNNYQKVISVEQVDNGYQIDFIDGSYTQKYLVCYTFTEVVNIMAENFGLKDVFDKKLKLISEE